MTQFPHSIGNLEILLALGNGKLIFRYGQDVGWTSPPTTRTGTAMAVTAEHGLFAVDCEGDGTAVA